MPTIEFSSGIMASGGAVIYAGVDGIINRIAYGNNFGASYIGFSGLANGPYHAEFTIMKGTIPTDFSTLTDWYSRSTDILLTISKGSVAISASQNPITMNSSYISASASGPATWFRFKSGSLGGTNYLHQQYIGTVGLSGSGADLEIDNTNIVSGNAYRIVNLKIQIPTSWTY